MDGEWESLGMKVASYLRLLVDKRMRYITPVEVVYAKLEVRASQAHQLAVTSATTPAAAPPDADGIAAAIRVALLQIARAGALHRATEHLFDICGYHHVIDNDPRWQTWEAHHAETAGHFVEAAMALVAAASHVLVAADTSIMASRAPPNLMSRRRVAVDPAPQQIVSSAVVEAAVAVDEATAASDGAVHEFNTVFMVVWNI